MDGQDGDKLFLKAAGRVVRCFLDVKKVFSIFVFLLPAWIKEKLLLKKMRGLCLTGSLKQ